MGAAGSDGRPIVILDEHPAVSELSPVHAAVLAGCMLLDVRLNLGKNRLSRHQTSSDAKNKPYASFHLKTSFQIIRGVSFPSLLP